MTGKFAASVAKFSEKAAKEADEKIRSITLNLFNSVITMSPVGNPALWKSKPPAGYVGGAFRGAWTTTIGAPGVSPTHRIDPSGSAAMSEVRANIGGSGKVTFLTNSLPYAIPLEYGHSQQAPNGMVRVSMAKVSAFEKAK